VQSVAILVILNFSLVKSIFSPIDGYNTSNGAFNDMKVSSSLQQGGRYGINSFFAKKHPSKNDDYSGQIQAYMSSDMYNCKIGCVAHVLLDAPDYIKESAQRSLVREFGGEQELEKLDLTNPIDKSIYDDYLNRMKQIEKNAKVEGVLPDKWRVKVFFFERDEEWLKELYWRIDNAARPLYDKMMDEYEASQDFDIF